MHMMQLWVNLPRKDKAAAPAYQGLEASQFPASRCPAEPSGSSPASTGRAQPARHVHPITVLE